MSFPCRFFHKYWWVQGHANHCLLFYYYFRIICWRVVRTRQQRSVKTHLWDGACGVYPPSKNNYRRYRRCAGRSSTPRRGAFPSWMSRWAAEDGFSPAVAFLSPAAAKYAPVPDSCEKLIWVPEVFISFLWLIYCN